MNYIVVDNRAVAILPSPIQFTAIEGNFTEKISQSPTIGLKIAPTLSKYPLKSPIGIAVTRDKKKAIISLFMEASI